MKSKDDILLEQAYGSILEEAKKKTNPWAVCNKTTGGKKKDPKKFEKCVKGVKSKGDKKTQNLNDSVEAGNNWLKEESLPVGTSNMTQSPTNNQTTQQNDEVDELQNLLNTVQDEDIKKALLQISKQREIEKLKQAAQAPVQSTQTQPQI